MDLKTILNGLEAIDAQGVFKPAASLICDPQKTTDSQFEDALTYLVNMRIIMKFFDGIPLTVEEEGKMQSLVEHTFMKLFAKKQSQTLQELQEQRSKGFDIVSGWSEPD